MENAVKLIDINEIHPWEDNPRKISKKGVEQVAASIKRHGMVQPIIVDQKKTICVGHTRYQAAKELGLKKIPVLVKKMTKAQFRALNLADNKTNEYSEWDSSKLIDSLLEIKSLDESILDATGFLDNELNGIFDDIESDNEDIEDSEGAGEYAGNNAAGSIANEDNYGVDNENDTPVNKNNLRVVKIFFTVEEFTKYSQAINKILEHGEYTSSSGLLLDLLLKESKKRIYSKK